jgi:hypothetical protein
MSFAIELVVESLTRGPSDRHSLEDHRMHRRRLEVDLKARTCFNYRLPISQVEQGHRRDQSWPRDAF